MISPVNFKFSLNSNNLRNTTAQNRMSNPVSFGAIVPDEVLFNNINKWLKPDDKGKLPIHYANLDKTKEIHSELENQPEILVKMHTTQDKYGNLPIHRADLYKTKEIHRILETQPEILAKMHTTKNEYGNLPIHGADLYKTKEIHRALETQPKILAEIHTTKNCDGKLPIDIDYVNLYWDENKKIEILQVIERLAYNTPEISVKDSIKLLKMNKGYDKEFDKKAKAALEYLKTKSQ